MNIRTIKEYQLNTSHSFNRPWLNNFEHQQFNRYYNMQSQCMPQADILELDDHYILEIALPGVVLDDVELKAEENYLTVVAKRTPALFEERAWLVRKEMPQGFLVRHFAFEQPLLVEHIEARLDRGILFISVPKLEAARRVPVSAGSIESHIPQMKTTIPAKSDLRQGKEVQVK